MWGWFDAVSWRLAEDYLAVLNQQLNLDDAFLYSAFCPLHHICFREWPGESCFCSFFVYGSWAGTGAKENITNVDLINWVWWKRRIWPPLVQEGSISLQHSSALLSVSLFRRGRKKLSQFSDMSIWNVKTLWWGVPLVFHTCASIMHHSVDCTLDLCMKGLRISKGYYWIFPPAEFLVTFKEI